MLARELDVRVRVKVSMKRPCVDCEFLEGILLVKRVAQERFEFGNVDPSQTRSRLGHKLGHPNQDVERNTVKGLHFKMWFSERNAESCRFLVVAESCRFWWSRNCAVFRRRGIVPILEVAPVYLPGQIS